MRKSLFLCCFIALALCSCKLLGIGKNAGAKNANKEGGCPTDGRNVGAEKLLADNPKIKKAPKYTKAKSLGY